MNRNVRQKASRRSGSGSPTKGGKPRRGARGHAAGSRDGAIDPRKGPTAAGSMGGPRDAGLRTRKRQFAEDLAVLLERMGLPPMAGRVWGWLLVCDPLHQTAGDLADALGASRGSISSMTRMLIQFRVVERTSLPGQRSKHYRVKAGGFRELLKARLASVVELRRMVDRGLELLHDEPADVRRRLEEYRDFYAFFEKAFPALIDEWQREHGREPS